MSQSMDLPPTARLIIHRTAWSKPEEFRISGSFRIGRASGINDYVLPQLDISHKHLLIEFLEEFEGKDGKWWVKALSNNVRAYVGQSPQEPTRLEEAGAHAQLHEGDKIKVLSHNEEITIEFHLDTEPPVEPPSEPPAMKMDWDHRIARNPDGTFTYNGQKIALKGDSRIIFEALVEVYPSGLVTVATLFQRLGWNVIDPQTEKLINVHTPDNLYPKTYQLNRKLDDVNVGLEVILDHGSYHLQPK